MSIRNVRERHRKKWRGAHIFLCMIRRAIKGRQDKETEASEKQPSKKTKKADVRVGRLFNRPEKKLATTTPGSSFTGPSFSSK